MKTNGQYYYVLESDCNKFAQATEAKLDKVQLKDEQINGLMDNTNGIILTSVQTISAGAWALSSVPAIAEFFSVAAGAIPVFGTAVAVAGTIISSLVSVVLQAESNQQTLKIYQDIIQQINDMAQDILRQEEMRTIQTQLTSINKYTSDMLNVSKPDSVRRDDAEAIYSKSVDLIDSIIATSIATYEYSRLILLIPAINEAVFSLSLATSQKLLRINNVNDRNDLLEIVLNKIENVKNWMNENIENYKTYVYPQNLYDTTTSSSTNTHDVIRNSAFELDITDYSTDTRTSYRYDCYLILTPNSQNNERCGEYFNGNFERTNLGTNCENRLKSKYDNIKTQAINNYNKFLSLTQQVETLYAKHSKSLSNSNICNLQLKTLPLIQKYYHILNTVEIDPSLANTEITVKFQLFGSNECGDDFEWMISEPIKRKYYSIGTLPNYRDPIFQTPFHIMCNNNITCVKTILLSFGVKKYTFIKYKNDQICQIDMKQDINNLPGSWIASTNCINENRRLQTDNTYINLNNGWLILENQQVLNNNYDTWYYNSGLLNMISIGIDNTIIGIGTDNKLWMCIMNIVVGHHGKYHHILQIILFIYQF